MTSLPPREAWIEINICKYLFVFSKSLPPREAWIEIFVQYAIHIIIKVASPAGSVD